ncbi:MAG: cyanophycinase, partial [Gemmatimonadaceae bacterium]
MRKRPGLGGLLIIGGKEDKEGERVILRMLAKEVGASSKLVVATVASDSPRELFNEYEACLRGI